MTAMLLYLLLGANAIASLFAPWIGVVIAYLFALLTPQNIWWWAFVGVRPDLWTSIPTIAGFGIAVLRGAVKLSHFATRINAYVAILGASFVLSHFLGPYVHVENRWTFFDPDLVFDDALKILLIYFVGTALIDSELKLKCMAAMFIATTIYMSYWANAQYLFHGYYDRLQGPVPLSGMSIYGDQNIFAVLFVAGFPFLYYFGRYVRSRVLTWTAWILVLPAWHAIFLTASRGALIGVLAILCTFAVREKKRVAAACVLALFALIFAWQAGSLMKERASTIDSSQDASEIGRFDAWKAAIGMMEAHPLTGVGLGSFGQAYPDFSSTRPHIAHNTLLQFGGENGVIAALAYLMLILSTLNRLWRNGRALATLGQDQYRLYLYLNEACFYSLIGFFACSIFLSLDQFELMYYLLIVANGTLTCTAGLASERNVSAPSSAKRLAALHSRRPLLVNRRQRGGVSRS
jgi:putative inorganic carbon (hco3(-)) transporter